MNMIGYIRVSRDDQARHGHSLALAQPQELEALAARLGHRLVDIVVDGEGEGADFRGISGGLPLFRRKGGRDLIARLRAGEAQGVLAYSLERMFRNVDDGRAFFQQYGVKRGVQVATVTEGVLDPCTVSGWMLINNLLLFGEVERLRTAERTRSTVQALRLAGRVYGDVPYGCVAKGGILNKDNKLINRELARDPATWPNRVAIVTMRQAGHSFQAIADELRRRRVPAPNGGDRWVKSSVQRVCDTHESLVHLPHADQPASPAARAPDAAASPESQL